MPISAHTGKIVEAESSRPAIAVSLNTEYLSSFQEKIEKYTEKRRFSAIFLLFYALVGRFSRTGARKKRIAASGPAPGFAFAYAVLRGGEVAFARRGWVFLGAGVRYCCASPEQIPCRSLSLVRPAEAGMLVSHSGGSLWQRATAAGNRAEFNHYFLTFRLTFALWRRILFRSFTYYVRTPGAMKKFEDWTWKDIRNGLASLAIALGMVYAPYAFMWTDLKGDIRELRQDTRELRRDTKEIAAGLARLEAHFSITTSQPEDITPLDADSMLAFRAGAAPVAVSVLDAASTPRPARLSRRFALAGARLLCDILPVVPGGAFLKAGYARSCQSCAIGASV